MATSTLSQGEPIHNKLSPSITSQPTVSASPPTILEEVHAQQLWLRERLAGALSTPPPATPTSLLPSVPVIDLAPSFTSSPEARRAIAAQIRSACLTTGFFQVSHHGIPESATSGILEQARRFFHDLTPAQKEELHIKHSPLFRGYEPGDYTLVNSDDINTNPAETEIGTKEETKQGFNFGYEPALDPTGGDGAYVELDGQPPQPGHTNVWPSETVLPGFQAGVAAYYGPALSLSRHLFRLFALSLDLPEDYFEPLCTHPGGIGRLLYYPAVPKAPEDGETEHRAKLGLGAHTDYECFTLLLADDNPGLEILFPPSPLTDNKPLWRPCPVRVGTITVNVGDFLMRWTNGLYKSTIHRVMSQPGTPARYSVPFFFSINYDAEVEGLPERVVGVGRYRPMKAGVYVLERLRATKTLGEGVDDVGMVEEE